MSRLTFNGWLNFSYKTVIKKKYLNEIFSSGSS